MYYVHYDGRPRHVAADSVQRENDAYVFRHKGEVVLHIDKKRVLTLRLVSDEELETNG